MLKNLRYKRKLEMQVTARVVVMLPNREAMPSKISGEGKLPMTCMFLGRGFTGIGRFAGPSGRERRSAENEDIMKFNEPYNLQIIEDYICI